MLQRDMQLCVRLVFRALSLSFFLSLFTEYIARCVTGGSEDSEEYCVKM